MKKGGMGIEDKKTGIEKVSQTKGVSMKEIFGERMEEKSRREDRREEK